MRDEGSTRFLDGMRVAREHLSHLQEMLLTAAIHLRQSLATGKVSYGFKVEVAAADKVTIGSGLAFDRRARPLVLEEARETPIDFGSAVTLYLVALYRLRSEGLIGGISTLLSNDLEIEARTAAPPYQDDAVLFAELHKQEEVVTVIQKGEWYLPPLDHEHSGRFVLDGANRWRYDGHPLQFQGPHFDSGFLPVPIGGVVRLVHGLKTTELLVQLQARLQDETITTKGFGQEFWYELVGEQEIRLVRASDTALEKMELRAQVWRCGEGAAGPLLPIADAGDLQVIEVGSSFVLDGSRSRALTGRQLTHFIWTQLS